MTPQERERAGTLLRQGSWFQGLPRQLQDAIVERSRPRVYAKGEVIAAEGSPAAGLYAILEGRVSWTRSVADPGGETLLYIAGPGAWFGSLALVRGTPTQFKVAAHTAARILVLPRAEYQRLIEEDPECYRRIVDHALERFEVLIRVHAESRRLTTEELIPVQLATLCELRRAELRQSGGGVTLGLSQGEVAAMVGVSRQTLNAALRRLAAKELIEPGFRQIRIADPARLRGAGVAALRSWRRSVTKRGDAARKGRRHCS